MAYNLSRNSRVFVTTNLNTATGAVLTTGLTTANTWEVQVLDGFKFSQGTNQTTININEASSAPVRGSRAFNTALNPVDITFSTYMRPRLNAAQATAEERVLWNALLGSVGIEGTTQAGAVVTASAFTGTLATATRASTTASQVTISSALTVTPAPVTGEVYTVKGVTGTGAMYWNQPVKIVSYTAGTSIVLEYLTAPPAAATTVSPAWTTAVKLDKAAWVENPTATGVTTSYAQVTSAQSNRNQLQAIGFIFIVDNAAYTIDNCAIDQAQIDFGLDAISMVAWTAKGTKLNQLASLPVLSAATDPVFSGSLTGTATGKVTTANYITNKLSTVTLKSNLGGIGGTTYKVVLTGGSVQIVNNINYVTPANIGVVNQPIGYFTGARAISGTMNAYLKTGTGETADLLNNMLSNIATASETKFSAQIEIGGSNNGTRVEFEMPGCMLGIPSVDVADVISTAITFNAQSTDSAIAGNTYDIENTNDVSIRYYSL